MEKNSFYIFWRECQCSGPFLSPQCLDAESLPTSVNQKSLPLPFSQQQDAGIGARVQSENSFHRKRWIWVRKISYAHQRPGWDYVFTKYCIKKQQHKTMLDCFMQLGIRFINKVCEWQVCLWAGYVVMWWVASSFRSRDNGIAVHWFAGWTLSPVTTLLWLKSGMTWGMARVSSSFEVYGICLPILLSTRWKS